MAKDYEKIKKRLVTKRFYTLHNLCRSLPYIPYIKIQSLISISSEKQPVN